MDTPEVFIASRANSPAPSSSKPALPRKDKPSSKSLGGSVVTQPRAPAKKPKDKKRVKKTKKKVKGSSWAASTYGEKITSAEPAWFGRRNFPRVSPFAPPFLFIFV